MEGIYIRFLKVPKGQGYWAGIFLILGIAGFLAALAFFAFNILFSAFGLMQMTGGSIVWNFNNPYIPAFVITSGGKIGLIMGIIGGLLASISEGRLWIVPAKGEGNKSVMERKNLFIFFSFLFVLYDILSSFYFLNDGFAFDPTVVWYSALIIYGIKLGATILLFSIGPEMFMVWAFETIAENYADGIPSVAIGAMVILSIFKSIGSTVWNLIFGDHEEEDETARIKASMPARQNQSGRGRGRPNREFTENEAI